MQKNPLCYEIICSASKNHTKTFEQSAEIKKEGEHKVGDIRKGISNDNTERENDEALVRFETAIGWVNKQYCLNCGSDMTLEITSAEFWGNAWKSYQIWTCFCGWQFIKTKIN